MTEIVSPPGYRVISAEEAEERFGISDDVEYPYQEFTDEQEIRLYAGGLRVAGGLQPEDDVDWVPYNVIVDGDLTVEGDLSWWDESGGNFLLVTGDLRARNVILSGCPCVVVRGDLVVENGIQGKYGDDGGFLTVFGRTRGQIIVSTLYFNMHFGSQPEAVLAADPHRTGCPVDFTDDELSGVVLPDLLREDGTPDTDKIGEALREGRPILRAGVRPSHVAAIEELEALSSRADEVTELDLSDRKLRRLPEQLFAFRNLRVLSLSGNDDIGELDERIGEFASLEELNVAGMRLTSLPEMIGKLSDLRVLDISGNEFESLPDSIGDLSRLEILRAERLTCPVPDALGRLPQLRELYLYGLKPGEYDAQVDFPLPVTHLTGLRSLSLSHVWLSSIPDDLLRLTELEELDLSGSLSATLERLPDLARLPRLRVLRLSGNTPWTFQPEPSRDLLAGVWSITTLEQLAIDRWNEKTGGDRPPFTALPDDAFSRMPGLRCLDLSFNELTELPESFFRLERLENVDLQYTKLGKATLDRLRATFPEVRMDLRAVETKADVDDPTWQAVHALVKSGAAALRRGERAEAVTAFEKALTHCVPGACFSDYDHLYALYGLVDALGHLVNTAGDDRSAMVARLVGHAERALSLVPALIWHYTDEGAFQEEVKRRAGNALAWHLMEAGDLDRALDAVDRALSVSAEPAYDYIRDTKVRILVAMGHAPQAYVIVDQVLTRDPDFGDFADFATSADFQQWRQNQRP
ncbi:leucine-rich repeat domain-containing protein [Nonomuraea sediminis]|uniref:leucine-rich repeat domain-containing protein n=1 Tax=Nonomuraea sediminis TaxID=2835864 RepID=UPI001BDD154F|nr:leucine-rich repeat domain-containing protein [Nonomuraea sediminis]